VLKSTSAIIDPPRIQLPTAILNGSDYSGKKLPIENKRTYFDARTGHNHGTKFRLRQDKFHELYEDVQSI